MHKRVLGIDENGLGPLMGPLVVTGTLLEYGREDPGWFDDIADSKSFFSARIPSKYSKMEETAAAIFNLANKRAPRSPAEILDVFCGGLNCFSGANICNGNIPAKFIWADPDKIRKRCDEFAEWAFMNDVKIEKVRSFCLCPNRINNFVSKGGTKILLDFLTFCNVIKESPEKNNLHVQAGKIGGLKFYGPYLRYNFPDYSLAALEEKNERSSYFLKNGAAGFRMEFIMDVEKKSFPAALSSIAGKYVREIVMESIRRTLNINEDISGYHDSKTMASIASLSPDGDRFPSVCLFRRRK